MPMLMCAAYLALTGLLSFFLGRLIPPEKLDWDRFPYKTLPWERGGLVYKKIGIQHWQNRVPDMSRIFTKLMPPKKMIATDSGSLRRMIQETCIAGLVHGLLCISGLYCIRLWPGPGGWIIAVLNALGNLVFVLIQRYNRPRLVRLLKKQTEKERKLSHANADPDL